MGYRYYDKARKPVRYPFGHGLSYTTFSYSDLRIQPDRVTVRVTNTGLLPGAEVVQLYIAPPQDGLFRPEKELKGFARLELAPGESREAAFELNRRSFALWAEGWKVPGGLYQIQVGASSRDIRLQGEIQVEGETVAAPAWQKGSWYETPVGLPSRTDWEQLMGHLVPIQPEAKKGKFTMDNTCMEMKDSSWIMRMQYKVTEFIIGRGFHGKKDRSDPAYRMMLVAATDCPMRTIILNSGGILSDALGEGLLEMANGHFIQGIRKMCRREKHRNTNSDRK